MPFCVSLCCVHQCGEEERSLRQYWYTSWPDQKTPDKAPPLLELVQEVERAREEAPSSSGPITVHCRYVAEVCRIGTKKKKKIIKCNSSFSAEVDSLLVYLMLLLFHFFLSLCSAGIGRTGCFIATSILCKQLRTEGVVDILRTTCQLRLDR